VRRIESVLALLAVVLPFPLRAAGARDGELAVLAAASLAEAMADVAAAWRARGEPGLRLQLGGSNELARQIAAGAPGDLFVSADAAKMDGLERSGLLSPGTRRDLLGNRLVVIVPADAPPLAATWQVDTLLGRQTPELLLAVHAHDVPAGYGDDPLGTQLLEDSRQGRGADRQPTRHDPLGHPEHVLVAAGRQLAQQVTGHPARAALPCRIVQRKPPPGRPGGGVLVEAAGIEPASASPLPVGLHA